MARYGEKTSDQGEYRVTGTYTYKKRVQGNRNVPQHYKDATGLYYTWFPKQEAAPAPTPTPTAPQELQISQASKDYRAETEKLLAQAKKQREDFAAEQVAAKKAAEIAEQTRIRTLLTAASNEERKAQGVNLQIKPASSTPQTGGTQPFKRRRNQFAINRPSYSGLSISQSGMVNV